MAGEFVRRAVPVTFIFVWASGYVVAKYGLPYAEPLTFLCLRYVGVVLLMGGLALAARASWPRDPRQYGHSAVAGVLMQASYLGGVWCAIKLGMPAGLAALIVNTQPILTAVFTSATGGRITGRQWLGLILGITGVALAVGHKITGEGLSVLATSLCLFALLAMTAGTLYQKRFCASVDVRVAQVVQFGAALVVTLPLAFIFESNKIDPTPQFWGALAWSVVVLSGGGITLLFIMIRRGSATSVTSYLYLVPPVTAMMAWLMFGESFNLLALIGMFVAIVGVALVVRRSPAPIRLIGPEDRAD